MNSLAVQTPEVAAVLWIAVLAGCALAIVIILWLALRDRPIPRDGTDTESEVDERYRTHITHGDHLFTL